MKTNWKITLTAHGRATRIERDGEEVEGVTAITVTGAVGQVPTVTLTMLAPHVEIVAETDAEKAP